MVTVEPPVAALADLDLGFEVVEGFSRPDWQAVREFVQNLVAHFQNKRMNSKLWGDVLQLFVCS